MHLNVLAPRGAAKSTHASLAYPLRCLLEGSEQYVVITSDTGDQAREFLDAIRQELEDNEAIARDYPDAAGRGPIWRDNILRLRNGCQVRALSTGQKLRGRRQRAARPTLIVTDDPQNLQHLISELQRERSMNWLRKDVMNAGDHRTNVIVLGTALHRDAIVCQLERTPGWKSRRWQSVLSWPERMDLWAEWEKLLNDFSLTDPDARLQAARDFYEGQRAEMDRGARVLWPERWPLYALMLKRASEGQAAFATEQQNDPIDPSLNYFPEEAFNRPDFWFLDWPRDLEARAMALDAATGEDLKRGDFSALILLGRDRKGQLYCEADVLKASVEEVCRLAAERARTFRPDVFAVEKNGFQGLLRIPLQQACAPLRVNLTLRLYHQSVNKDLRIQRLGPDLEQGRIRFKARSAGTLLLVQQLRDFPQAAKRDGPDGLELCKRALVDWVNGKRT